MKRHLFSKKHNLSSRFIRNLNMKECLEKAVYEETEPLGKQVLCQLKENLQIAGQDMIPICQDTGMAVVFPNPVQFFLRKLQRLPSQSLPIFRITRN